MTQREREVTPSPDRLDALEAQVREQTLELEVLQEVAGRIGTDLNYATLLRTILARAGAVVPYDVAASLLQGDDGQWHLFRRCVRPLSSEAATEVEERLITACQRLWHAQIPDDQVQRITTEESYAQSATQVAVLRSFFMVPILANPRPIGCIFVGAEGAHAFSEKHVRLLSMVAGHASGAIERTRAFLEKERMRLRAILEQLPEGVALLDEDAGVVLANPAASSLLERLAAGKERSTPFLLAKLQERTPQDFAVGTSVRHVVQASVAPLFFDDVQHWLLTLVDVTASREAVRNRDRFLAMLSHELRNPLAALSNAAQVLELEKDDQVLNEVRPIIRRQTRHLSRLVDDLLDLSRFLHGKIRLNRQPLDIGELVRHVYQVHRSDFQAQHRTLVLHSADEPLWILGDAARLTQVLDNLLNNACKFTATGGVVQLTCQRENQVALVEVQDDGVGIPGSQQEVIFEPFIQIENPETRRPNGLGLGLALVKSLVELHDGGISVASDGDGRGSVFSIRLPLVQTGAQRQVNSEGSNSGDTRLNVLLIEDNPDVRQSFKALLEHIGHRVTAAASGKEGLEIFSQLQPSIIFVDIGLPEIDGYAIARRLRATEAGANAFLIAMTGYAQPEDKQRALDAGFDLHLAKPAELKVIRDVLTQANAHARGKVQ